MNSYMNHAIRLALENVQEGGQPFGAVLVRNEEVLAEGVNELHLYHDVSGHAELLAIRRAQKRLNTNDLSGCVIYASGEPCAMCLTAMYFAGINQVYFCQSVDEATAVGLTKSKEIYHDLQKPKNQRSIKIEQLSLDKGQLDPMKLWKESN